LTIYKTLQVPSPESSVPACLLLLDDRFQLRPIHIPTLFSLVHRSLVCRSRRSLTIPYRRYPDEEQNFHGRGSEYGNLRNGDRGAYDKCVIVGNVVVEAWMTGWVGETWTERTEKYDPGTGKRENWGFGGFEMTFTVRGISETRISLFEELLKNENAQNSKARCHTNCPI
jgi:hypothetical protein